MGGNQQIVTDEGWHGITRLERTYCQAELEARFLALWAAYIRRHYRRWGSAVG